MRPRLPTLRALVLALALSAAAVLGGCAAETRGNAHYNIRQTAAGCVVDSNSGRTVDGPASLSFTATQGSCTLTVTAATLTQGADRSQGATDLAGALLRPIVDRALQYLPPPPATTPAPAAVAPVATVVAPAPVPVEPTP